MHQRYDRNQYIEVFWDNISKLRWKNFDRLYSGMTKTIKHFNISYDFDSIVHYGESEGGIIDENSKNLRTIRTLNATNQHRIGQRAGVSRGDIQLVKLMYGCKG